MIVIITAAKKKNLDAKRSRRKNGKNIDHPTRKGLAINCFDNYRLNEKNSIFDMNMEGFWVLRQDFPRGNSLASWG
jgi:hypothetical protein